jgi:hypothetical protein
VIEAFDYGLFPLNTPLISIRSAFSAFFTLVAADLADFLAATLQQWQHPKPSWRL